MAYDQAHADVLRELDELKEKFRALAAVEEFIGEGCDNASHNIRDVLSGTADPREDCLKWGLEY